jgi:hypothetical protein
MLRPNPKGLLADFTQLRARGHQLTKNPQVPQIPEALIRLTALELLRHRMEFLGYLLHERHAGKALRTSEAEGYPVRLADQASITPEPFISTSFSRVRASAALRRPVLLPSLIA